MNELTDEHAETIENQPVPRTASAQAVKSLEEQRQELCLLLQANRRLIARKLVGEERQNRFPRSAVMRFVSNHSTREILHKAANAALGLQTYRVARWGLSALNLIRKGFRKI